VVQPRAPHNYSLVRHRRVNLGVRRRNMAPKNAHLSTVPATAKLTAHILEALFLCLVTAVLIAPIWLGYWIASTLLGEWEPVFLPGILTFVVCSGNLLGYLLVWIGRILTCTSSPWLVSVSTQEPRKVSEIK
jgi:hypothetical protein